MREVSVFAAECLCGRKFETPSREYVCPPCHWHIRLEWGWVPEAECPPENDAAHDSAEEAVA